MTYSVLAFASFSAKQYAEGIRWASRAINDMPTLVMPHVSLTCCLVGRGRDRQGKSCVRGGAKAGTGTLQDQVGGLLAVRPARRSRSISRADYYLQSRHRSSRDGLG